MPGSRRKEAKIKIATANEDSGGLTLNQPTNIDEQVSDPHGTLAMLLMLFLVILLVLLIFAIAQSV